jgi:hypothetical protein
MSNRRRNSPSPACTSPSLEPAEAGSLGDRHAAVQGGLTSNWRPRSRRPLAETAGLEWLIAELEKGADRGAPVYIQAQPRGTVT